MSKAEQRKTQLHQWRRPSATVHKASRITIFCDLDGPLIDVSERYYQTYQLGLARIQALYQTHGLTLPIQVLSKRQFWQMKQDRTPDTEIAMRSGLQAEQIDCFLSGVRQWVNHPTLLEKDQLQPGVRWALAFLHSCGYRLAVVTLRCQAQAVELLQKYELAHLFTAIYGTDEALTAYHNYAESKQRLLAQVLNDYPLGPSEPAWMIGDTEADVLAGQALGIPTIALTCGIRSSSYLHQLQPNRIHSDLLSAAHYLAGLPQLMRA